MESGAILKVQIVVIGEASVGKSRLTERFAENTFTDPYWCTIGRDFVTPTQFLANLSTGSQSVKLMIWDTAGQERFHTLTKAFYRNARGALLVYDITDRNSFVQVSKWAASLQTGSKDAAAVLVGTKLDLEKQRKVSFCEGVQLAGSLGVPFVETSAKACVNVDQAFYTLLARIGPTLGFSVRVGFEKIHRS